jgi:hypothetical protein
MVLFTPLLAYFVPFEPELLVVFDTLEISGFLAPLSFSDDVELVDLLF